MGQLISPASADEVRDAVAWAVETETPLVVQGAGTKSAWGRPPGAETVLDLSRLTGIDLYEPAELVLTAKPGTTIHEITATLAASGQRLAFEPPDLGPLLGGEANAQTVGGVIACNLAGPRRLQAGAARDHFLGFSAVSGRAEPFKSGGRVVKNVTGFDLSKLLAGSFGTLGVFTSVTVKVLPIPEVSKTVAVVGADDGTGVAALTKALKSPHEISGAAHLPEAVARVSGVHALAQFGTAVTALRLEGPVPSVEARAAALTALLSSYGEVREIEHEESEALWREIATVQPLLSDATAQIWRLSVPPASAAAVAEELRRTLDARLYYDWGGGLIWAMIAPAPDANQRTVRGALRDCGGHATLLRAAAEVRAEADVFQPAENGLGEIARGLKSNFDPHGVLNPGRMYADV